VVGVGSEKTGLERWLSASCLRNLRSKLAIWICTMESKDTGGPLTLWSIRLPVSAAIFFLADPGSCSLWGINRPKLDLSAHIDGLASHELLESSLNGQDVTLRLQEKEIRLSARANLLENTTEPYLLYG